MAARVLIERKAIYRQLFDRVNTQSYIVPLTTSPSVFATRYPGNSNAVVTMLMFTLTFIAF